MALAYSILIIGCLVALFIGVKVTNYLLGCNRERERRFEIMNREFEEQKAKVKAEIAAHGKRTSGVIVDIGTNYEAVRDDIARCVERGLKQKRHV